MEPRSEEKPYDQIHTCLLGSSWVGPIIGIIQEKTAIYYCGFLKRDLLKQEKECACISIRIMEEVQLKMSVKIT